MRSIRVSWRSVAVAVATVLVAMLAGAALRGAGEGPGSATPTRVSSAPAVDGTDRDGDIPAGPGPREQVDGVGVGFSRDEPGAVAAAVSYATAAQSWLYLDDAQVERSAARVVAPDARERLVGDLVGQVGLLRGELDRASGTVWFVVAPLATRVDSFSDDRAVVRVWLVRVLSAEGVAVPQSGWETLRFDLVWHDGDWRIDATTEVPGPTPQLEAGLQPWSAAYLDEELAGFTRIGARP